MCSSIRQHETNETETRKSTSHGVLAFVILPLVPLCCHNVNTARAGRKPDKKQAIISVIAAAVQVKCTPRWTPTKRHDVPRGGCGARGAGRRVRGAGRGARSAGRGTAAQGSAGSRGARDGGGKASRRLPRLGPVAASRTGWGRPPVIGHR